MFRKRLVSLLLVCTMIAMTGCGNSQNQAVENESSSAEEVTQEVAETAEETAAPDIVEEDNGEIRHIQMGVEQVEKMTGETNLDIITYKLFLWNEEEEQRYPDLTKALASYAENLQAESETAYTALLEKAQSSDYAPEESGYSYEEKWEPTILRSDSRVVSVGVQRSHIEGADGGHIWYSGVAFDAQTGKELSFTDVVTDKEGFFAQAQLRAEEMYYNEYRLGTGPDVWEKFAELAAMDEPDMNWTMDSEAVYLLFHGYELGQYEYADYAIPVYYSEVPEVFAAEYLERPESYMLPCVTKFLDYYIDVNGDGIDDEIMTEPEITGEDEAGDDLWTYTVAAGDGRRLNLEKSVRDESHYIAYVNGQYYMLIVQELVGDIFRATDVSLINLQTMEVTDTLSGYPMDLNNQEAWELMAENQYTFARVACSMTDPSSFYIGNKEDTISSYNEYVLWEIDSQDNINWKAGEFTSIQCANVLKTSEEITVDVVDMEGNVIGTETIEAGVFLNMVRAYMDVTYIDFQLISEEEIEKSQWSEEYEKKQYIRLHPDEPIYRIDWTKYGDSLLGQRFWG